MDFSFLKALAASVRGQVSSLKNQSQKLHACANDVFGQPYLWKRIAKEKWRISLKKW